MGTPTQVLGKEETKVTVHPGWVSEQLQAWRQSENQTPRAVSDLVRHNPLSLAHWSTTHLSSLLSSSQHLCKGCS